MIRRRKFLKRSGVTFGTVAGTEVFLPSLWSQDTSKKDDDDETEGDWYPQEEESTYTFQIESTADGEEPKDVTKQSLVEQALEKAAEQYPDAELPSAADLLDSLGWAGEGAEKIEFDQLTITVSWEEWRDKPDADPTKFRSVVWEYGGNIVNQPLGDGGAVLLFLMIVGHEADDVFKVGDAIEMHHGNVTSKAGLPIRWEKVPDQPGVFKFAVPGNDPYVYTVKKVPRGPHEPQKVYPEEEDDAKEEHDSFEVNHSPNVIMLSIIIPVEIDGEVKNFEIQFNGKKWNVPTVKRPE